MKKLSLTALRAQLYQVVDKVIETGIPQEIDRNGHKVKIVVEAEVDKLKNLVAHSSLLVEPEALVE